MILFVKTLLCAYLKANPIILCSLYVVAIYEKLQIQVPALKTFPFCSTMRDCTNYFIFLFVLQVFDSNSSQGNCFAWMDGCMGLAV